MRLESRGQIIKGKINPSGSVWEQRVLGAVEGPGKWAYVMGVTYGRKV